MIPTGIWVKENSAPSLRGGGGELGNLKNLWLQLVCTNLYLDVEQGLF